LDVFVFQFVVAIGVRVVFETDSATASGFLRKKMVLKASLEEWRLPVVSQNWIDEALT